VARRHSYARRKEEELELRSVVSYDWQAIHAPPFREESEPMIALIVTVNIKPRFRGRFMEAMMGDARGANEDEPGCLRFDVIQDAHDPNRIYLYEVYRDDAALEAHRKAPHYLKWRETVADWFATDTVRFEGTPVYPPEEAW